MIEDEWGKVRRSQIKAVRWMPNDLPQTFSHAAFVGEVEWDGAMVGLGTGKALQQSPGTFSYTAFVGEDERPECWGRWGLSSRVLGIFSAGTVGGFLHTPS